MSKIRYDPITGEEVIERAPVQREYLGQREYADPEELVRVHVLHHEDPDQQVFSAEWPAELLAERFAQMVTDVRAMRFAYINCGSDAETERDVMLEWATGLWNRLESWSLWNTDTEG